MMRRRLSPNFYSEQSEKTILWSFRLHLFDWNHDPNPNPEVTLPDVQLYPSPHCLEGSGLSLQSMHCPYFYLGEHVRTGVPPLGAHLRRLARTPPCSRLRAGTTDLITPSKSDICCVWINSNQIQSHALTPTQIQCSTQALASTQMLEAKTLDKITKTGWGVIYLYKDYVWKRFVLGQHAALDKRTT